MRRFYDIGADPGVVVIVMPSSPSLLASCPRWRSRGAREWSLLLAFASSKGELLSQERRWKRPERPLSSSGETSVRIPKAADSGTVLRGRDFQRPLRWHLGRCRTTSYLPHGCSG